MQQLWTHTGRVVVSRQSLAVTVVAMISKQGLVVVVLIPVERLDFQAASLRVPTNNTGNGLVHLVWGACSVGSQEQDLLTHILPTLHAGELKRRTDVRILNTCLSICDLTIFAVWGTGVFQLSVIGVGAIVVRGGDSSHLAVCLTQITTACTMDDIHVPGFHLCVLSLPREGI